MSHAVLYQNKTRRVRRTGGADFLLGAGAAPVVGLEALLLEARDLLVLAQQRLLVRLDQDLLALHVSASKPQIQYFVKA